MKARQLIGGAAFPPDVLKIIFEAFDEAWAEVSPEISSRPAAIDSARTSLASIVLGLAVTGPVDRQQIRAAAVDAFRRKHRLRGN
jgi:hypothetical protein